MADAQATPEITTTQQAVFRAYVQCVVAKLNPSLKAITQPHDGSTEYELDIEGRGGMGRGGVLHEDIEQVLQIATENGGRAFIQHGQYGCAVLDEGNARGRLTILWPHGHRGPAGPGELTESEEADVVARGGTVSRPEPESKSRKARAAR